MEITTTQKQKISFDEMQRVALETLKEMYELDEDLKIVNGDVIRWDYPRHSATTEFVRQASKNELAAKQLISALEKELNLK